MGKPSKGTETGRKANSPYHKHAKKPYQYSPNYHAWCEAWKRGDQLAAKEYSDKLLEQFGGPVMIRNARRAQRRVSDDYETAY